MHEDLIGIGELATRTGLSHKALRLYGDRGCCRPRTSIRGPGSAATSRSRSSAPAGSRCCAPAGCRWR
ncbi:hypothetical protein ACFQ0M_20630 [Kitasatospora aburaviensis]